MGQILVHAVMCARGEEVAAKGQHQGNDEDEHDDEVATRQHSSSTIIVVVV